MTSPTPTSVRYNDWRQVKLPAPEAFTPALPVSVIIPYYQTPVETLARTLAALEGQTYPRDLFEIVIVDDGSEPPLVQPQSPLDIRIERQERYGFGIARARNTGARVAAHDILLFLDSDMLPEAGWIAAHARWHHTVSDALTAGLSGYVSVSNVTPETIRCRPGPLKNLFEGQAVDVLHEGHLLRTNDLTSRDDSPFMVVAGNNFGMRRYFYQLVGGSDESFTRWGYEDVELAYRAYTRGGLVALNRDAFAWHQGRWDRDKNFRGNLMQSGKAAHLIAHRTIRGAQPGRIYTVPQYVVTVDVRHNPAGQVITTVANILADRVFDLVVRIEMPAGGETEHLAQIREAFGMDPRVRVASLCGALDEFPATPFHITLSAGVAFAKNLVSRLRAKLGNAVIATSVLPDGSRVSITRAWALHRARRAGGRPADFGAARTLPVAVLKVKTGAPQSAVEPWSIRYPGWRRILDRMQDVHNPSEAWAFLKWGGYQCRRRFQACNRSPGPHLC